jgi:hypothetical protein
VPNLNKKIYAKIEAWRNRLIEGEHPNLYLDGSVMTRSWAGDCRKPAGSAAWCISIAMCSAMCRPAYFLMDDHAWTSQRRGMAEKCYMGMFPEPQLPEELRERL